MEPRRIIAAFDVFLSERGLRFEAGKLFGLCDRAEDLGDCVAMAPTAAELRTIEPWLKEQDGNPDWPAHVLEVLGDLRGRLGHGL